MAEQFPEEQRREDSADAPLPPTTLVTLAEVDFVDFAESQNDPKVAKFLQEAKDESTDLQAAGLIHPGG